MISAILHVISIVVGDNLIKPLLEYWYTGYIIHILTKQDDSHTALFTYVL